MKNVLASLKSDKSMLKNKKMGVFSAYTLSFNCALTRTLMHNEVFGGSKNLVCLFIASMTGVRTMVDLDACPL